MLGKVYLVYTTNGRYWLYKKNSQRWKTGCRYAMRLFGSCVYRNTTRVCDDDKVVWIKPADRNYIAMWNRTFNDNIEFYDERGN